MILISAVLYKSSTGLGDSKRSLHYKIPYSLSTCRSGDEISIPALKENDLQMKCSIKPTIEMNKIIILACAFVYLLSCRSGDKKSTINQTDGTMITDSVKIYGYNLDFLKKHVDIIELRKGKSSVAVVPAWQGRVMTSTSEGYNTVIVLDGSILI